jgi:hypothetical protein
MARFKSNPRQLPLVLNQDLGALRESEVLSYLKLAAFPLEPQGDCIEPALNPRTRDLRIPAKMPSGWKRGRRMARLPFRQWSAAAAALIYASASFRATARSVFFPYKDSSDGLIL